MNAGFLNLGEIRSTADVFRQRGQNTSWCLVVFTADSWIAALHIVSLLSANRCQRSLPVWHHHILLIMFSLSLSRSLLLLSPPPPPIPSTWRQQMRHCWRGATRQQPSPTFPSAFYLFAHREKKQKNRWAPSVSAVSVSHNCLGQQTHSGTEKKKEKSLCQTLWSSTTSGLLCFRGRISHRARR